MSTASIPSLEQKKPRRRIRRSLVAITLGLLVLGGLGWWTYTTTRPDYRLRLGLDALRQGDENEEGKPAALRHLFAFAGRLPPTGKEQANRLALLLTASGNLFHAHMLQGHILFQSGQYYQALLEIDAMAQFKELHASREDLRLEAATLAGKCLVFLKEHRRAEATFQSVLQSWPKDLDPQRGQIDAHRGLFTIYYDQGALNPALYHMEEVSRLDPQDGRAPRTMGFIYKDILRNDDLALENLTEALQRHLAPRVEAEVRLELAEILLKKGKVDQALQVLQDVGDHPKVLAIRADCLRFQGHRAEARALLDQALAKDPGSVEALRLLADLHLEAGEPFEAIKFLRPALEKDPHDLFSLSRLSRAYKLMGDQAEAEKVTIRLQETKQLFEKMTKLTQEAMNNPWDPAVRFQLADTCRQLQMLKLADMWTQAAKACSALQGPAQ